MNVTTAMTRFFERKHDTLKHIYELEKALDPPSQLQSMRTHLPNR